MPKRNGFAKIRAGLEDHLIAGCIGFFEAGVYTTIHLQADFKSGLWIGSAPRLLATAGRGASLRAVQHALERLAEIQFLRAFHIPGTRGNYPVLIHKYEPSFGALKGMRLNAVASEDWRHPVYEPVAEGDTERVTEADTESDAEDAPSQEVEVKTKKQEKPSAAAPRGDPRHQPFVEFATQAYATRFGQAPTWSGKDFKKLGDLLRRAPVATAEDLQHRFAFYLDSTDSFIVGNGHALWLFCSKYDALREGPIVQRGRGSNGKPTVADVASKNWTGLGLNRPLN